MSKCEEKTMLNIKQMSPIFNEFVSVQHIGSKIGFCIMTLHSGLKACSNIYAE